MKSTRPLNFEVPNLWAAICEIPCQKFILATDFLLLFAFSGLYHFLSPNLASQPWDSLSYAYSAEVNGISAIWGNHPLGHVIFSMLFSLVKRLGYQGRALTIFQTTNGILGGLIIAIFFVLLVSIIKVRVPYALGFSLVLGASYGFWFFAGTGDIYHFSILCSLFAWTTLVYEVTLRNGRFPLWSGFLTGLSILFHQLNIMLIPVGLALILFTPNPGNQAKRIKIKKITLFIAITSAVAASGYLSLGYAVTSSFSVQRITGWMRGYFGDPTYGRYLNTDVFKTAWMTISQAVMFAPQNKAIFISRSLLAFFVLIILFGLFANKALEGRKRAIMVASSLECLITWPLILWWEPQNPKFWLLTLVPFFIFLALSFEAVAIRLRDRTPDLDKGLGPTINLLPLLVGALILAMNVQHINGTQDSVAFQEALNVWVENSSQEDVLITAGDLIPHLRFWGSRPNTVYLYRSLQASQASPDDFSDLRNEINQALCTHHTVLITPAASEYVTDSQLSLVSVSRGDLRSFLDKNVQKGKIAFWYRDLFDGRLLPVYIVKNVSACSGEKSGLPSN
jgi:hypothetical protein